MSNSNKACVGYYTDYYMKYGKMVPIMLEPSTYPHCLYTGASGTGKSFTILYMIGMYLKQNPDTIIYFFDFKRSEEFCFLNPIDTFYSGNDCIEGLRNFYSLFSEIREIGRNKQRYLLCFDELPSFINYCNATQGKKVGNEMLSIISEVLMLGRGLGFSLHIGTQRASASLFIDGSRDNFHIIIHLGKPSKEVKSILFSGCDIDQDRLFDKGEGIMLIDGKEPIYVKYPLIRHGDVWKSKILEILMKRTDVR